MHGLIADALEKKSDGRFELTIEDHDQILTNKLPASDKVLLCILKYYFINLIVIFQTPDKHCMVRPDRTHASSLKIWVAITWDVLFLQKIYGTVNKVSWCILKYIFEQRLQAN